MLSFFRKLSIGGKIKDGILPERIMEAAEDLSIAKNQSALILKTDIELKESVYGKLPTICISCVVLLPFGYYSMSGRWCDIVYYNLFVYLSKYFAQSLTDAQI